MRQGFIAHELQPLEDMSKKEKERKRCEELWIISFLTTHLDKGTQKHLMHQLSLPTWKALTYLDGSCCCIATEVRLY